MHFASALLFGASIIAAAVAQNTTLIAFTTLPGATVQAGVPVQLAWSGGDGVSAVTITLKQGPQTDLTTVAIITGDATGNSYTWTPSSSLPNADDYALQISQGIDDSNYSGTFSLTGGSTTTSMSSSSTTSSMSVTTAIIVAGPSGNATIINPTVFTTTLAGTAASSGGTGIPMSRNTTFSTASLSTGASDTSGVGVTAGPSGTATGTMGTTGATGTQGGGGTPTGTAGSTGASPSSTSAADAKVVSGSSLALVLCAAVGMWMLN
ncbi:hypothetical protein MMC32_006141 [Xylographa parallela]|nr:hypothetical protein [Xylographa parallela]